MKTLDEIGLEQKTDKSSSFHYFTRWYDLHFSKIRENENKIFEIGILNGSSLRMWKEYFHNSSIFAMDIKDLQHFEEDKIKIFIGDQINIETLGTINKEHGPFDVIIDDASHVNSYTATTFLTMFPLLKSGGIYVIEDLHTCYWPEFGEQKFTDIVLKPLLDMINSNGKSGCGDLAKDQKDDYFIKNNSVLDWWESNVKSMSIYRGIVFIEKW